MVAQGCLLQSLCLTQHALLRKQIRWWAGRALPRRAVQKTVSKKIVKNTKNERLF